MVKTRKFGGVIYKFDKQFTNKTDATKYKRYIQIKQRYCARVVENKEGYEVYVGPVSQTRGYGYSKGN